MRPHAEASFSVQYCRHLTIKQLRARWLQAPPDGKRLAFVGRRLGANARELFIVSADSTEQKLTPRLEGGGLSKIASWSPDGKRLALSIDLRIHWIDVEGAGAPRLLAGQTGKNRDPAWSPDGKWIAFARRPK